ncbi:MAG: exodeoxyribonuclease VII large subunit [Candidatus Omnitrophota bacterium]
MSEEFFSVSALNTLIRDVITAGIPQAVWVCGEIQSYDRNKGKQHAFFELVEKSAGSHEIKARVGLVIWANTRFKIDAVLKKAENAFELKDDIEVKFLCKVDYYPGFGQIRLIVENIDPVYTLGKIAQDRQKLIAELSRSGVFQRNKSLDLSRVPLKIGLVTAHDSAAYNDFLDELGKSGYAFQVHLARALMQGKNCAPSVCCALKDLDAMDGLDMVVITRGGGSIAELACFDSREIVLAVAASRFPVLTGIGHEINTSITDLAAHTQAKTPTAAAQFLVGRVKEYVILLDEISARLKDATFDAVGGRRVCLKDAALDLQTALRRCLIVRRENNTRLAQRLKAASIRAGVDAGGNLSRSGDQLKKIIQLRLGAAKIKIGHCQKLVDMASPRNILKRGFSITRDQGGKAVRSVGDIEGGQRLDTELADGRFVSIVQ